jgi:predicted transcriptional regulator
MVKRKNTEEYINILTSVRLDGETSRQLKRVTESLDISQSTFIRQAIRNGIAAAGVVA